MLLELGTISSSPKSLHCGPTPISTLLENAISLWSMSLVELIPTGTGSFMNSSVKYHLENLAGEF